MPKHPGKKRKRIRFQEYLATVTFSYDSEMRTYSAESVADFYLGQRRVGLNDVPRAVLDAVQKYIAVTKNKQVI